MVSPYRRAYLDDITEKKRLAQVKMLRLEKLIKDIYKDSPCPDIKTCKDNICKRIRAELGVKK